MLPPLLAPIILTFAPVFFKRTWNQALVLLWGAILAPGKRTVTSALRIMGLSAERQFQKYHRVLNRAVWDSRRASQLLLRLLISQFARRGPIVVGLDDTIERRRGSKIKAKGIYRDPVRSSHSHFVKTGGLRWLSLMLLAPIPWARQVWALPFLTALAPSERYSQQHRQRHKALTDWARQLLLQLRRWLPDRDLVVVADGAFAALDLLTRLVALRRPIHLHYPPSFGRQALQTSCTTPQGKTRPSTFERSTASQLATNPHRSPHPVENTLARQLVWPNLPYRRDDLRRRHLVPRRVPAPAYPLGTHPRSTRTI